MVQLYKNDQPRLARELRWMGIMLRRADIVPLEDKQVIERRLSMYDDLMEKDPKMQKLFAAREAKAEAIGLARGEARGEAKGKVKGKAEGKVKAVRTLIVEMVEIRFVPLTELAQQRVKQLRTLTQLHLLFRQLTVAHDEQEARALLNRDEKPR